MMQLEQHWEEELHAAAQVPLHFATKATTGTAIAPNRWLTNIISPSD